MKQILFWHVVSHSEENDKQVPTSLLSTHQIQKYLDPISSLPQVHCSIKRNTTDWKKKSWTTEHHSIGRLREQELKMWWPPCSKRCNMLTNFTQLSYYGKPGHGANRRTLGQTHDLKNKLQNYSCSKWQTTDLRAQWHVNCIASWTFLWTFLQQCFVSSGLGWCPAKTESTAFIQKPRFQCLG